MKHEMICIGCPMGCEISVTENSGELSVSGNECKIGEKYGKEETINPTRNITSSVVVTGGDFPLVSVKTAKPVPKRLIMECMNEIKLAKASAPIEIGDVIVRNAAGTGVDIVATRRIKTR